MNLVIFTQSSCGGAERISILLGKILAERHNVIVHSFGPVDDLKAFVDGRLEYNYHQRQSATKGFVREVREICKRVHPDMVFCSLMPLNWRTAVALLGLKTKLILRSDNYISTQSLLSKIRLGLAYRIAHRVIAQTDEMRMGLIKSLKLSDEKVVTIANPIDIGLINKKIKEINPLPHNQVNYVAVGRVAYEKGFDMLIKAFTHVRSIIGNSHLYIIGNKHYDDVFLKVVSDLVSENDLSDYVHFVGFTNNPYVYMKYANCFVLSSRNEGLPNVLIESQYCGTPAAAMKCIPVIERIVTDGRTGYLANHEDIEGLADAMIKCLKLGQIDTTYNSDVNDPIFSVFNLN